MSADLQKQIDEKLNEVQRVMGEYNALCKTVGQMDEVADYTLADFDGQPVKLSAVFGEHEQLLLVHNMGFACPYCTLWADGFNGLWPHVESGRYGNRAKFLLVSNDTPQQQREGSAQRGWSMPMLSCAGTTLFADLGFTGEKPDEWWPGASILTKQADGRVTRHAMTYFGPGDPYCSLFHFFNLLPTKAVQAG